MNVTTNEPLKEDFRKFLYVVWKHLRLPEPTPIQYDIAYYLQHGDKRMVLEAFRGVGKSWITSAFVCWLLYCDPQLNIMVVSASKNRADDFSTFTLRIITEMEILKHLVPREDQRKSKISFDVAPAKASHQPSVKSGGILGQLTGSRGDVIIGDDVEVPNNSQTQVMRDKMGEVVKEFDAIVKPGGRIIFLGTPQCEQSLYNVLAPRGYSTRIYPARYPSKDYASIYGDNLAPYIGNKLEKDSTLIGQPTDPQRFDELDLQEREASYGRTGFALQFMLDTRLSDEDRYPLKVSDLVIMNTNPESAPEKVVWASAPELIIDDLPCVALNGDNFYRPMRTQGDWIDYQGSVLAIDPSGRGQDETAYAVVKMLNGQLFVTDLGGTKGGYADETLKALAVIAKRSKVNMIVVESNFGDGMFTQLLTPIVTKIYPVTIEEVRHHIQKERRIIDTLEPVMNNHKLIIDKKVIERDFKSTQHHPPEKALQYQLIYQMTRISSLKGALKHDDRLDVLSIAVNYWVEQMAADVDRQVNSRKEELLKEELDKFMEGCVGYSSESDSKWMQV
tara:strand:+ start:62 stop:1744 length:1683 start_codon:yes stop_codon:yes gene_type:complete